MVVPYEALAAAVSCQYEGSVRLSTVSSAWGKAAMPDSATWGRRMTAAGGTANPLAL